MWKQLKRLIWLAEWALRQRNRLSKGLRPQRLPSLLRKELLLMEAQMGCRLGSDWNTHLDSDAIAAVS